jgi:hypothetical protein
MGQRTRERKGVDDEELVDGRNGDTGPGSDGAG